MPQSRTGEKSTGSGPILYDYDFLDSQEYMGKAFCIDFPTGRNIRQIIGVVIHPWDSWIILFGYKRQPA